MSDPCLVILGCGRLGAWVAQAWQGPVVGVRRQPPTGDRLVVAGDISQASCWQELPRALAERGGRWPPGAVLVSATPGLRRGRDHGLAAAVALARMAAPRARLVYSATTAVYRDAGGAAVTEDAPLAREDPAIAGLLAIEEEVARQDDHLILRLPALVAPGRTAARERLVAQGGIVRGALERPFPYLHEADAAELLVRALRGGLGTGIVHAASGHALTLGDFYRQLAAAAGLPPPRGDDTPQPARRLDCRRLRARGGELAWRLPWDEAVAGSLSAAAPAPPGPASAGRTSPPAGPDASSGADRGESRPRA